MDHKNKGIGACVTWQRRVDMFDKNNRGRIGRILPLFTLVAALTGCEDLQVDDVDSNVDDAVEERATRLQLPRFTGLSIPELAGYLKTTQQIPETATVNTVDQLISSLPGGDPTFTCNSPMWSGQNLPDGAKLDIEWCCDNGWICIPQQITFTPKGGSPEQLYP